MLVLFMYREMCAHINWMARVFVVEVTWLMFSPKLIEMILQHCHMIGSSVLLLLLLFIGKLECGVPLVERGQKHHVLMFVEAQELYQIRSVLKMSLA